MNRLRTACAATFVGAGALHFVKPEPYRKIVPPYLPAPEFLVAASGVTEAAGGLGLLHPATRRGAGWLLIATMVGVFPANLHMAMHPEKFRGVPGGERALKARLPLQLGFIAWIWGAAFR